MKIKTLLLVTALICIISFKTLAGDGYSLSKAEQSLVVKKMAFEPGLRVNGFAFYAFDDKVDSYYSNTEYFRGKIKGGFQYGGGLEYMMAPTQSFELFYLRLDTEAPIEYYKGGIKFTEFDVATNYVMAGGNRYFPTTSVIEPFLGLQAGLAIFNVKNPDNGNSDNATKFAWGAKAGLNIWATEKVGLKIQTGLLSAVQAVGGGFYFGTGGGGVGVSTYSTFYQFYIGGGLSFNLAQ